MKLNPGAFFSQLYLIFLVPDISRTYRCIDVLSILQDGFNYHQEVFFK